MIWTKELDDELSAMVDEGFEASEAAGFLNTTRNSALSRARRIGNPFPRRRSGGRLPYFDDRPVSLSSPRGESPTMDPLLNALLTHHRDMAPPELVARMLPIPLGKPTDLVGAKHQEYKNLFLARVNRPKVVAKLAAIQPSIDDILSLVVWFYKISLPDLISDRRKQDHWTPRQIAMYLASRHTMLSFPKIGKAMRRDHSTVIHGVNLIADRMTTDERLRDEIEVLEMHLAEIASKNRVSA